MYQMGKRKIQDSKSTADASPKLVPRRKYTKKTKPAEHEYRLPTAQERRMMEQLARPKVSMEEELRLIAAKQKQFTGGAVLHTRDEEVEYVVPPRENTTKSPPAQEVGKSEIERSLELLRKRGFRV